MLAYERLAFAYFGTLIVLALAAPAPRRWPAITASLAVISVIAAALRWAPLELRYWLPHLYLIAGYWVPALMTNGRPSRRFEAWLVRSDERLRTHLPALGAAPAVVAELAYLLCYPLVPLSFVLVRWMGDESDIGRFWLAVLSSGYACYVTLPWLLSRPPRLLVAESRVAARVRALNAFVLDRVSHAWTTFPSGHVAVACAAAASLLHVSPTAGVVVGVMAGAVAVGAAAGRYHFVVDVAAGVLVACVAAVITW